MSQIIKKQLYKALFNKISVRFRLEYLWKCFSMHKSYFKQNKIDINVWNIGPLWEYNYYEQTKNIVYRDCVVCLYFQTYKVPIRYHDFGDSANALTSGVFAVHPGFRTSKRWRISVNHYHYRKCTKNVIVWLYSTMDTSSLSEIQYGNNIMSQTLPVL